MKKQKNKLTPKQREQIIVLRFEKNWGLREIAEKFGVTTQNISYYIRQHKKKHLRESKKEEPKNLKQQLDPISFRLEKLREVSQDIQLARREQVIHSLPTFHKLHMSIHNELREFISANKDIQNLDPDTIINEMVDAISSLPISLKTQITRKLQESQAPNVYRLKTK